MKRLLLSSAFLGVFLVGACSGSSASSVLGQPDAAAPTGTTPTKGGGDPTDQPTGDDDDDVIAEPDAGTLTDGGTNTLADPEKPGPFEVAERSGKANERDVHAFYPKTGGPGPVVIVAHGMLVDASQYDGYLQHLASFGYVALTVDFAASITGSDNAQQAKDLIAGIDWAKTDDKVSPHANTDLVGMTGHSLGGKLALHVATLDARVKAAIVLDPVDGGGPMGCNAPKCVNVITELPKLPIPTAFLGETLDTTGMGLGPACSPAASGFQAFYAKANAPKLAVTITGAAHMSFIDDTSSCGIACTPCKKATAKQDEVLTLARAYVVSFYERHLRGNAGYDAYLTGSLAKDRYVKTKRATIESK